MQNEVSQQILTNRVFSLVFLFSAIGLIFSYGIEMIQKIEPCRFCYLQRGCCFLLMALSLFGIFSSMKNAVKLCIFLFALMSLAISCYHIGIQVGFFQDSCAVNSPNSIDNFRKILFKSASASCSSVSRIFGIPLSVLNFIFSLICVGAIAKTLKFQWNPKAKNID